MVYFFLFKYGMEGFNTCIVKGNIKVKEVDKDFIKEYSQ